ncbi:hypothetical protein [Pseudomonas sp.]|uniref:hypothetical protein n=1 Tax=Pseudomonas sp. TaxID=306 RepID=UPI0025855607|nr:hypothetical protein [Pseudomonas sp.]
MNELQTVINEVRRQRQAISEALASGRAGDFADYKRMCGVYDGLGRAEIYATELMHNIETSDD